MITCPRFRKEAPCSNASFCVGCRQLRILESKPCVLVPKRLTQPDPSCRPPQKKGKKIISFCTTRAHATSISLWTGSTQPFISVQLSAYATYICPEMCSCHKHYNPNCIWHLCDDIYVCQFSTVAHFLSPPP